MSLGITYYPAVSRGRACKLKTLTCVYTVVMVTGKCTDVFRGVFFGLGGRVEGGLRGGGGLLGKIFPWEELLMGEDIFNEGGAGIF